MKDPRKVDQFLVLGFFAFAAVYMSTMHLAPYAGDFAIKAMPIVLMAVMVALQVKGLTGVLLLAGFILSAGGDVALAFVNQGHEMAFVIGLGLFLAAHLMYTLTFILKLSFQRHRLPLMAGIVVFSFAMIALLLTREPGLGTLQMPVLAYVAVITMMGVTACMRDEAGGGLMLGALLFIVSDATLAINKFVLPADSGFAPYAQYVIMLTYYAGQYFIGRSFIPYTKA